jgi:hypothetical protein
MFRHHFHLQVKGSEELAHVATSEMQAMTNLIRSSAICLPFIVLLILCVTTPTQKRTATVIAQNATLRQTPSTTGLAEEEVSEGTTVKVLDEKSPWYIVRIGDRVGWMHAENLHFTDDTASTAHSEPQPEPSRVNTPPDSPPQPTRSTADRTYIRGPKGGCYYISSSGSKVYVDRSMCN